MRGEGDYRFVSEIGDAESISKGYVSRMLRLTLLAPDAVEAIVAGSLNHGMMPEHLGGSAAGELGADSGGCCIVRSLEGDSP
jgi:hypothetical protein